MCSIPASSDFYDLESILAGMQILAFLILLQINKKAMTKHHTMPPLTVGECGVVQAYHSLSRKPAHVPPAFQMFWAEDQV